MNEKKMEMMKQGFSEDLILLHAVCALCQHCHGLVISTAITDMCARNKPCKRCVKREW